ncbi:MAG: protein kinase [Planctomycetota bacterium]
MQRDADGAGGWRVGAVLAGHRLLESLGAGAGGQVWRALHLETGGERALKLLAPEAGVEDRVRFAREAEALARLDGHPHLLRIHGVEGGPEQPILILDLARGDLAARLKAGPLSTEEARRIARELATGLAYVHAHGFLHRDLKPQNVLFADDGRALLGDFGLVRRAGGSSLTQTGAVVGTPAFMAPEQALSTPPDERTDVYGLGAVLYAMLTGQPPFTGASALQLMTEVCTRDPAPPSSVAPEVDPGLEAVCLRALQRDPARRYPSARAFAEALDVEPLVPRRGRGAVALGVVGALALVAGLGLLIPRDEGREAPAAAPVEPLPPATWARLGAALQADGAASVLRDLWSVASEGDAHACWRLAQDLPAALEAELPGARRLCLERGAREGSPRCEVALGDAESETAPAVERYTRALRLQPVAEDPGPDPRQRARVRLVALCAADPDGFPAELELALRAAQEAYPTAVDPLALERDWLVLSERVVQAFLDALPEPRPPSHHAEGETSAARSYGYAARYVAQTAREDGDLEQAFAWSGYAATLEVGAEPESYVDMANWLNGEDPRALEFVDLEPCRLAALRRGLAERAARAGQFRALEFLGWSARKGAPGLLVPYDLERAVELWTRALAVPSPSERPASVHLALADLATDPAAAGVLTREQGLAHLARVQQLSVGVWEGDWCRVVRRAYEVD